MDRRKFLQASMALGCSAAAHPLMTTVTLAGTDGAMPLGENRLIVMVLRGAMDGLDVVQPRGEAQYAQMRPSLAQLAGIDLNGFFSLHAALGDLMPLWAAGELSFVHATSTPYRNKRSHFEGQDLLEAGTGMDVPLWTVKDGWLNRMLQTVPGLTSQTAYAIGRDAVPMLQGLAPVRNWAPETRFNMSPQAQLLLEAAYEGDPLFHAAAMEAMEIAGDPGLMRMQEAAGVKGGAKLDDIGRLVKFAAERLTMDTRIAAFSLSGWDTHRGQARALPNALARLQYTILQLKQNLGPEVWGKTTLLAMTEFGRTARENGTGGTDHGTAGLLIAAGGAVKGGQVLGQWPGLGETQLLDQRDLTPTSDVRDWAAYAMQSLYGLDRAVLENAVFPGLQMGTAKGLIL
jgi:uncharacterized protein (DUF1501 family)